MKESTRHIQARPADATDDNAEEMLEIYCYLACMGPEYFDPGPAIRAIAERSDPDRSGIVGMLLDPVGRTKRSLELGTLLSANLAARVKHAGAALRTLLPALVRADTENGFRVLESLAAAAPSHLASVLVDVLLANTLAESRDASRTETKGDEHHSLKLARIRYLVSVISRLDLEPASRSRVFLALSQSLQNGDLIRDVVLSSLFPSSTDDSMAVLLEGNDEALSAVLDGAAARPNGKAEFYRTCRAVMASGCKTGLPVMGRVHRLLKGRNKGLRALSSMVRSAVLLELEQLCASRDRLAPLLPEDPEPGLLDLLTIVLPGLVDPYRSETCDYLLDHCAEILTNGSMRMDDVDIFTQVVVGATVLHESKAHAGSKVRAMLLDAAGALHVMLQSRGESRTSAVDAIRPFRLLVEQVEAEFRRRSELTGTLDNVLPLLASIGDEGERQRPSATT